MGSLEAFGAGGVLVRDEPGRGRFVRRIRASLVLRMTMAVLGVAVAMGMVFLALAGPVAGHWERSRQREAIQAQIDAVETDASSACFVADKGLAQQIVSRLAATRDIRSALLRSPSGVLAQAGRGAAARGPTGMDIARAIPSPFPKGVPAGELVVAPDLEEAARQGAGTAWMLRAVMLCLATSLGLALAYVVQRGIIRPIATLSGRLHRLEPETGAALVAPPGHDRDEIGQLVWDVNALVQQMVLAIDHERMLRGKLVLDQRKVEVLLNHAGTGIFVLNGAGALEAWTPAFLRMLGLGTDAPLRGAGIHKVFGGSAAQVEACLARCAAGGPQVVELLRVRASAEGECRWFQLYLDPVEKDWIQGLLEDVTSFRDATEAARQLALRDSLTGVLNRLGAEQALEDHFAGGREGLCLMMVDLDLFKQVNDTHGHDAGDEVLRQATARMAANLRQSDLVARLGGDEFLLILGGLKDEGVALEIADKMIKALAAPMSLPGGGSASVGASLGIALQDPAETPSRQTLLKRADLALYQAKQAGRNCARVFQVQSQNLPLCSSPIGGILITPPGL